VEAKLKNLWKVDQGQWCYKQFCQYTTATIPMKFITKGMSFYVLREFE
jgi:hypothetical protein